MVLLKVFMVSELHILRTVDIRMLTIEVRVCRVDPGTKKTCGEIGPITTSRKMRLLKIAERFRSSSVLDHFSMRLAGLYQPLTSVRLVP